MSFRYDDHSNQFFKKLEQATNLSSCRKEPEINVTPLKGTSVREGYAP